jgi:hypothetical protein
MDQPDENALEWKGRSGPFTISLGQGVFHPTHTSRTLAEALEISPGDTVIDVGCGSGVLSFVAARLGAERVIGCDLSAEAVEIARRNATRLGLQDRVEFRVGNLLDPCAGERASVIIGDVSGIPDEIGLLAGWFPDGKAGGPTGAELPVAMPDGDDPERDGPARDRAEDLRRREPSVTDPAGVSPSRGGGEVQGGRADDAGGAGQLPPSREPAAVASSDLAMRAAEGPDGGLNHRRPTRRAEATPPIAPRSRPPSARRLPPGPGRAR